jgi:hypothetical protein
MLEHLGAENDVVAMVMFRTREIGCQGEVDSGKTVKTGSTFFDSRASDLGAGGPREEIVNHREKSSVAASVVEQPAACVWFHHAAGHFESAAMAPLKDPVAREELLARVVSRLQAVFE